MKKKNFILLYCIITFFVLSFNISNANYRYTNVMLNGKEYGGYAHMGYIKNHIVMLPLSDIADILRLHIDWNAKEKKILITGAQNDVTIYLSNQTAYIGKNKYKFDASPEILGSKLFVPITFFEKAFNTQMKYDFQFKMLYITDNKVKRVYKTNKDAFIKGDLKSDLAIFPSKKAKDSEIKVNLFGEFGNFSLVLGEPLENSTQNIIGYWYSINIVIDEILKNTQLYSNSKLSDNASMQAAFADLDKDGSLELILAIRDEIIDGEFYIIKLYNYVQLDGLKQLTLRSELIGDGYFQTEIRVDKNGHLIIPIGTQGLFNEYKLKNNKLVEVKN